MVFCNPLELDQSQSLLYSPIVMSLSQTFLLITLYDGMSMQRLCSLKLPFYKSFSTIGVASPTPSLILTRTAHVVTITTKAHNELHAS